MDAQVSERIKNSFFAAVEFWHMIEEPEFRTDYEGVMRVWMQETPGAEGAGRWLLPALNAMLCDPETPAGEWGHLLNTFFALRALMGLDECRQPRTVDQAGTW